MGTPQPARVSLHLSLAPLDVTLAFHAVQPERLVACGRRDCAAWALRHLNKMDRLGPTRDDTRAQPGAVRGMNRALVLITLGLLVGGADVDSDPSPQVMPSPQAPSPEA